MANLRSVSRSQIANSYINDKSVDIYFEIIILQVLIEFALAKEDVTCIKSYSEHVPLFFRVGPLIESIRYMSATRSNRFAPTLFAKLQAPLKIDKQHWLYVISLSSESLTDAFTLICTDRSTI